MSVGVGRGRGRLPPASSEPPRRPGAGRGGMMAPAAHISDLLSQSSISPRRVPPPVEELSNPNITTVVFFESLDKYFSSNPSEDDMRSLITDIFDKAVSSIINVDCVTQCIFLGSRHSQLGHNFLSIFYAELQKKFEGRNQIRSCSESGYWRFVKFFSSVCYFTRNILFPPFEELIGALLELIKTPIPLKSNKDDPVLIEEISTLAVAVVRYYSFRAGSGEGEDAATCIVRDLLFNGGNWHGKALLWLLACLESSQNIAGASPLALQYYLPKLGPEASSLSLKVPTVELPASASSTGKYKFQDIGYTLKFV